MATANTNTSSPKTKGSIAPVSALDGALAGVPESFRKRIVEAYSELKRRYSKARYDSGSVDAAGLSAGKLAEAVLRLLQQELTAAHTPFGQNIPNFADECRKLITQSGGVESLRVIMPRALVFLYTLRGKRGIGHVGGDVEANAIDLETIVRTADWIVCELVRVYHKLSLEEAQALVDALSERSLPEVWEVGDKKRVLRPGLKARDQVLLLLYSSPESAVFADELFGWVEYSSLKDFRRQVLRPLHAERLVEFDPETEAVIISPTGVQRAESLLSNTA